MEISPLRRHYTSDRKALGQTVSGPLAFLKLVIEDLNIPYLYFKRSLRLVAGSGASFRVQQFDLEHNVTYLSQYTSRRYAEDSINVSLLSSDRFTKGKWLASKHIAPATYEERELFDLQGNAMDQERLAAISVEVRILAHEPFRSHKNIVDLIAFSWEKYPDECGRRWPFLILESADCGTLLDFSRLESSPLANNASCALSLSTDILTGLDALHKCGVIHGDLKFENILVFELPDGTFQAKISDFGLSVLIYDLEDSDTNEDPMIQLPGFTQPWEPPEAYGPISMRNLSKVDIYSFGLLFCRVITGGSDVFADFKLDNSMSAMMSIDRGVDNEDEIRHDYEQINQLKSQSLALSEYMCNLVSSYLDGSPGELEAERFYGLIKACLHCEPEQRGSIVDLMTLLAPQHEAEPTEASSSPVPLLFGGTENYSGDVPEEIYDWNRDLVADVSLSVIDDMLNRSASETQSGVSDESLYWLASWALSGDLGNIPIPECLSWLIAAAQNGSIKARARIFNIHAALEKPIPAAVAEELETWVLQAVHEDESPGQTTALELIPQRLPQALRTLSTIYCGYGQDCFGDQWRCEFPLDDFEAFISIIRERNEDVNTLHDYPGLACGMTWLHYASSEGNLEVVKLLLACGSDPNVVSDYEETPFFMACQAGHYAIVRILDPLTKMNGRPTTELHSLDRFHPDNIEAVVELLLNRGIDIDAKDDMGLTPLNRILFRNGVSCDNATKVLLRRGGDPLIRDDKNMSPVGQAAANMSADQLAEVLKYVPEPQLVKAKAEALHLLLELNYTYALSSGGRNYRHKLKDVFRLLLEDEVCRFFEEDTYHPVLTFACASAPPEMVTILLDLLSNSELHRYSPSARDWLTPLHAALAENRLAVVQILLAAGADPTASTPADWTPLFYAAIRSAELVSTILRHVESKRSKSAAISFATLPDHSGATAFATAVVGEFYAAADILAAYEPDFRAFTFSYSEGTSTLMNLLGVVCYMAPQLEYLFKLLGDCADDPDEGFIIDDDGVSILHAVAGVPVDRAPEPEQQRLLSLVLHRFPHPRHGNWRTKTGNSIPLHHAARFGHVSAIKTLYETFGEALELNVVSDEGLTPLDEAERRERHDVSDLGLLAREVYKKRTKDAVAFLKAVGAKRAREVVGS